MAQTFPVHGGLMLTLLGGLAWSGRDLVRAQAKDATARFPVTM
jgi:hypothetical protein